MAEGKLSLMDVLAFAKAGYKPADVKEIMAMSQATEEAPAPAPEDGVKNEVQNEPEEKSVANDEPDYKMMYADLQKQVESLTSKLEAAQKANINTDVSRSQNKLSTSETINNIFREVIS